MAISDELFTDAAGLVFLQGNNEVLKISFRLTAEPWQRDSIHQSQPDNLQVNANP